MSDTSEIRNPKIIQEEINDLQEYLNGIPDHFRESGLFNAYKSRLSELNEELPLSADVLRQSFWKGVFSQKWFKKRLEPLLDMAKVLMSLR